MCCWSTALEIDRYTLELLRTAWPIEIPEQRDAVMRGVTLIQLGCDPTL